MYKQIRTSIRQMLPHSIAKRRILSGPLRGKSIVTSWYDYPAAILGWTEPQLLSWFERSVHPGETWLDIGAHYGYTAIALSRLVGLQGRVFAFEPAVATAGCVSRARELNRFPQLTVIPIALGSAQELSISSLPEVRGMISMPGVPGMVNGPAAAHAPQDHFLLAGLDWLWPRIQGNSAKIAGVKIDVQGMELEVLKGMANTLRTNRPKLALELHAGVSRGEVLDLLSSLGYSRQGVPIEPLAGETQATYADNRSYEFLPSA